MKQMRTWRKRIVSFVLVLALAITSVPFSDAMKVQAETLEQGKTWLENRSLMKNDFIGLLAPSDGRYAIGTTGGNPDNENDQNQTLLFRYPSRSTSYTTFRINGESIGYWSTNGSFDTDRACHEGDMDYKDIHITQRLSIVPNSATGRDDMVEIRYTAVNNSDAEQEVGCRIMMDTMIGGNDSAPFRIPEIGAVTTETEFKGNDVPQIWQGFNNLSNPSVIAQGRFYKSEEEKPDKVQFGNWRKFSNTAWECPISKGAGNGDSGVTATWYEKLLAPGETREYVTYYGLSELSGDFRAPLALGVYSETQLEECDGRYMPNPFPVNAYIENIGTGTAEAVSVKLELPKGLQFAGDSEETIELENIKPKGTVQASWQVEALPVYTDKDYKIRVVLSYDNGSSKSVTRTIHVPAATKRLREVPAALKYTLFSESSGQDLSMYGWKNYVTGDVYTGKNYVYSGSILDISGKVDAVGNIITNGWQLNIDERNEHSEKIEMPDLKEDIISKAGEITSYKGSKTYTEDAIRLDKSVQAEENITFAGTTFQGDGYFMAGKDITCGLNQGSTYNDGKIVMYSEKGNITLNGSELYLDGILYAPEGTVSINANIFHLKGRIIAKHIVMNTSQTYIEGDSADTGYIFDETGTGDADNEKGHYERTFTLDEDFSEGRLADVSQRVDDALVLEHADSAQGGHQENVEEYDLKTDGTGFTLKDSLDRTKFLVGNEEAVLTYALKSFVDGSAEPDPHASEYDYVAAAAGRKVLLETTLLHAENIDTGSIRPEADHVIENEDGSVTLQWQYDRLTAGDNFTYKIPLKYKDIEETGIYGITRNASLQYYDAEGEYHVTCLKDRYVSVTDSVPKGTWEICCDAEKDNTDWNHISWNGIRPDDSDITVEASVSDNGEDYGNAVNVTNGAQMDGVHGRYLKVKVTLHASASGKTPQLDDLTVSTDGAELVTNLAPELTIDNEYELAENQPLHLLFASRDDTNGAVTKYALKAKETLDSDIAEITEQDSFIKTIQFCKAGTYVFEASASDGELADRKEITFHVTEREYDNIGKEPEHQKQDTVCPEAEIDNSNLQEPVDGKVDIIGTACDDRELSGYILTCRNQDEQTEHIIKNSENAVEHDVLGNIDTADYVDGLYILTLTVTDASGNWSTATASMEIRHKKEMDVTPPEAVILEAVLDEEQKDIIITGTAKDEVQLQKYLLTMTAPSGEESILAEGNENTENKVLAQLDTENLESGEYILTLRAVDTSGNESICTMSVQYTRGGSSSEPDPEQPENPDPEQPENPDPEQPENPDPEQPENPDPEQPENPDPEQPENPDPEQPENPDPEQPENPDPEQPENPDPEQPENPEEKETRFILRIDRHTAGTGDTISGLLDMDNIEEDSIAVTVNEEPLELDGQKFSYTAEAVGEYVFEATATDKKGENVSAQEVCRVYDRSDRTGPVVKLISPKGDAILEAPADITGTVTDDKELAYYRLEYALEGSENYITIAEGDSQIEEGILGHLDTTMLMNGVYTLRLTAEDKGGNRASVKRNILVEGELKIGNMHIGFTDLTAVMGGTNISVNRIYDSRNKEAGDFGTGWTLGLQGMRIYEGADIWDGYRLVQTGSLFSRGYQIKETKSHDVTVAYGDGTSDRFELTFTPERSALVPITETTLGYRCVTNPKVKLEILGDPVAMVAESGISFFSEAMYDDLSYKLTTEEGAQVYIHSERGVYKITDTDGSAITVDRNGYHAENGKSITFTRDEKDRVTKAEDPAGNTVTYSYDDRNDLVSVTDYADRTVSFTYDRNHNLVSITDPSGAAVARNEYDDEGRLVAATDADGNRMEYTHDVDGRTEVVSDRLGNKTVYVYDDHGNVLSTTDANGKTTKSTYDSLGNVLSKTDAKGNVTTYAYDESGNMTAVTDAEGNTAQNTYDSSNRVTSMKTLGDTEILINYDSRGNLAGTTDAEGNRTEYSYDMKGNVTGISDGLGTVMSAKYDKDGNVIETTDSAGNKVTSTYDESGRRLTRTAHTVTENGTEERTTHYVYNAAGELVQTVDADGNTISVERNDNGRMSATIDSKGRRTEYEYDRRGNVTKIIYPDGTTEQFTYDAEDRNTKTVSRTGLVTVYVYDKVGNLLKQTDARGNTVTYTYDSNYNLLTTTNAAGAVTTYAYDALNRNTSITDAEGNVISFTYNAFSLQTSVTDARGNVTRYEYDGNGNRTKIIYSDGTDVENGYDERGRTIWQKDAKGRKTEYTYDGSDRLVSVKQPDGAVTSYTYDQKGNLTAVEDSNGSVTKYEYDPEGRRTRTILADGSTSTSKYDKQGMLTETVDYNQVRTSYQYDEQDRILKEQTGSEYTGYAYDTYGRLAGVKTKSSNISYTYNKYGELEQKTYENGEAVRYLYDKYGRTSEIQVLFKDKVQTSAKYEYDKMNRLTRVIGRNGEATVYTYDANGNRETATFANGVKLTYTYDDLNRLILQKSVDKNGTVIAQYKYTLGKNGERTKVTESGACGEAETAYDYDKANRLVKETIRTDAGKTVYGYSYDKAGNRTCKETDGIKTSYTYDSRNRLTTEKTGNSEITYHYDANGNLVKQSGGADTIYVYDVHNRLTSYRQGEKKESYTYDAEGVRRSRTTGADSIYFVSDTSTSLSQTLAETDGRGNPRAEYTRADSLTAQARDGKISYYLHDGHGDVRALLSEAGKITDQYRYSAYGELTEKTGNTENHYLYTGEYYDGTSSLYYLRARYMNPSTGNFLTMDTYEGSICDPDTLHKYLYANGNPVTYSDPSGNMSVSLSELSAGMLCMGLLCTSIAYFNYTRAISNAGIIPGSSRSLMESLQTDILVNGTCTFPFIAAAIEGKIKGEIEIYEGSAIDAVDEMDRNKEVYYVYFLKDPEHDQIEYVGRTKHLKNRITAHENSTNRKDLQLAGFVRMKSYAACRAVEQAAMLGAHTLKGEKGKEWNNQINGVGKNNGKAGFYYHAADSILNATDKTADYLLNQMDNERLNQLERYIGEGMNMYEKYYSIY